MLQFSIYLAENGSIKTMNATNDLHIDILRYFGISGGKTLRNCSTVFAHEP